MEQSPEDLASLLKYLRGSTSQRDLAALTGNAVSASLISHVETRRKNLSVESIRRIAAALELDDAELDRLLHARAQFAEREAWGRSTRLEGAETGSELAARLAAMVRAWEEEATTRENPAVVAIAGWVGDLLAVYSELSRPDQARVYRVAMALAQERDLQRTRDLVAAIDGITSSNPEDPDETLVSDLHPGYTLAADADTPEGDAPERYISGPGGAPADDGEHLDG